SEADRARLAGCAARTAREFDAVFAEIADLRDYARLAMTTLLLCCENTTAPCRKLIDQLSVVLPRLRREVIAGAGHMAPLTHAAATNSVVLDYLRACTGGPGARRP